MGIEPMGDSGQISSLALFRQASAIQVRDFRVRGALRGNVRQLTERNVSVLWLLGTEEGCRDDRDTILPPVRALAGRDDHHVRQGAAELVTEP